jgi:hypothetical protein
LGAADVNEAASAMRAFTGGEGVVGPPSAVEGFHQWNITLIKKRIKNK